MCWVVACVVCEYAFKCVRGSGVRASVCVCRIFVLRNIGFAGKERQVAVVDVLPLRQWRPRGGAAPPGVAPTDVPDAFACTCLTLGWIGDGIFMCAALTERIMLLKWNPAAGNFSCRKVRVWEGYACKWCACWAGVCWRESR